MRKGYIDTEYGQVHYRSTGSNGPVIMLLHITPTSSAQFDAALPHLGAQARAYALDTPGYGMSDPPPGQIGPAEYGDRILAAMRKITTEKVVLVGIATGAVFALEAARRSPKAVSHLVLGSVPFYTAAELVERAGHLHEPDMRRDGSHIQRVWTDLEHKYGAYNSVADIHQMVMDLCNVYDRNLWGLKAVEESLRTGEMERIFRAVCHPTLVLSPDTPARTYAKRVADLIPGATLEVITGAGIPLPYNNGPGYADHILRFVQRTPPCA